MSAENRAFFEVIDPITVVVNFQGASPPEGYHAFISELLAPVARDDSTTHQSTSHQGIEWPSGVVPGNFDDSYSIFVCAAGTVEQMLDDARVLGKAITTQFPTLRVYKMTCAGYPTKCDD